MKLTRNILLGLFLIVVALPSSAQNIGYQGRRTTFMYNAFFMPRAVTNSYGTATETPMNLGHSFEADISYSPSNSIGIAYRMMNSRQPNMGKLVHNLNSNQTSTVIFDESVHPSITPSSFGIFIKFRNFKKLAPLGLHQRLSLYYNTAKVSYEPAELMNPNNYTVSSGHTKPTFTEDPLNGLDGTTYSNISLGYSIGSQRVVKNRFIISYGIELVYPLTSFYTEYKDLFGTGYNDEVEHFKTIALTEMNNTAYLNVHFGFGILGPRKKSRY